MVLPLCHCITYSLRTRHWMYKCISYIVIGTHLIIVKSHKENIFTFQFYKERNWSQESSNTFLKVSGKARRKSKKLSSCVCALCQPLPSMAVLGHTAKTKGPYARYQGCSSDPKSWRPWELSPKRKSHVTKSLYLWLQYYRFDSLK